MRHPDTVHAEAGRATVMSLFLRWAWINTGAVLLLAFGAVHYWKHLNGLAVIVLAVILGRFGLGTARAGRLCWMADKGYRTYAAKHMEHLRADAWECQMCAIMGTALGFFDVLTGDGDVIKRVQHGAGAAVLLGTFTGVLASLVLERVLRWLEHETA